MSPFEKSRDEAATKHAAPHYENHEGTWGAIDYSAFKSGADWAAQARLDEVLELLRSNEAKGHKYAFKMECGAHFADWLEARIKKEAVKGGSDEY